MQHFFTVIQRPLAVLCAGVFVFVLDQLVKIGMVRSDWVDALCNPGVGLGMPLSGSLQIAVVLVLLLCVAGLLHKALRSGTILEIYGYAGILTGGASNLVDRLYRGCVVDYIPFFGLFHCNIADVSISVGALAILIALVLKRA